MKEILKDPVLFLIALSIVFACTSLGNSIITALVFTATTVSIFLKDGIKPFKRKSLILYLGFVAIVLIYAGFGKGTLSGRTFNMSIFSFISMFSVFMVSYHVKTLNNRQIKALMKVAMIALLFSIVGTTVVSYINPMAIRVYGFGEMEGADLEIASRYYRMGMMSYSLAHSMSVVVVGLSILILYARSKWLKIVSAVMLLLTLRLLFIMTITTALLLAVIGVAIVFANYFLGGRAFITISLTVLVVAGFFLTGLSAMFLDFSEGTNLEITKKLADLFSLAKSGAAQGQIGYRIELYWASLKTFFSNPIFGWGSDNGSRLIIGEHSYMFDYMAYYGLFALLLFLSWWNEYHFLKSYLTKNNKVFYYYAFIPVAGLFILKGSSVCGTLPFMSLVFIQIVFLYMDNLPKENRYSE